MLVLFRLCIYVRSTYTRSKKRLCCTTHLYITSGRPYGTIYTCYLLQRMYTIALMKCSGMNLFDASITRQNTEDKDSRGFTMTNKA